VTRNVATLVEPPKSRREEVRPFSEEEARRLLDAVAGDRLDALYATALALGLRQGELLGLRWEDVDLAENKLEVRRQLQQLRGQPPILKALKTRASRRTLDLPPALVERLAVHRERQRREHVARGEDWAGEGLLFPSTAGTPLIPRNLTRHYKRLLRRAGLPERRFHDLRHTAASLMFGHGLEATAVQRVLGHSSIAITNDTYIHLMPQTRRQTAAAMEAFLRPPREERD
jgi:integrase